MPLLDSYNTSLEGIEHGDQKYEEHLPDGHGEEQPDPPDYERRIPIGEDARTGRTVYMRLSRSDRIGIFGRTGSGKTDLSKNLLSRLFLGGYELFYPNDVKNDYQDIDYQGGASNKLVEEHSAGLHPGEIPQPIPKKMYGMPFLLDHYRRGTPSYITPFTFSLEDVSSGELLDILSLSSNTQKRIIERIWNRNDEIDLARLQEELQSPDFNDQAAQAVMDSVSSVRQQKVLSDDSRYDKNPLDDLGKPDRKAVIVSYKKWKRFKREGSEKLELYIAIMIRQLMEKIEGNEIDYDKGVVVFIDEAHAFAGDQTETDISQAEIIDLVDLGRAYDIPMVFATQRPSQLPKEAIVEQMSHHFVSKTVPESDLKTLLKQANIMDHADYSNDKWTKILRNMGKYQRLYIDVENSRWRILDPYAPLVAHRDSA